MAKPGPDPFRTPETAAAIRANQDEEQPKTGIMSPDFNAANDIKDMSYPGSNLHNFTGDKKDQYAVKVSGNWRVFSKFIDGDAYVVDYDNYH